MNRILFLCPRVPYPLTGGAKLRMFNTAKILSEEYTVDLLIINEGAAEKEHVDTLKEKFNDVTVFSYPRYRFYSNAISGVLSRKPLQVSYYLFRDVQSWVEANHSRYDLFYCYMVRMAEYVRNFDAARIVDFADALSQNYEGLAKNSTYPQKLLYRHESNRLRRYEREILREFDHSFITTAADREHITEENPSTCSVVPNGVKPALLESEPTPDGSEPWVTFLGKMDYSPNEDAVQYFADEVFPDVHQECPETRFIIVGSNPSKTVQSLGTRQNVEVTGFVDDPAEYLERSKVIVAPIRSGGGIQNKILEAMAIGKPVVTTPLGKQGLEATADVHLRVAANASQYSDAVVELLNNREARTQIGKNARQLIESQYRWNNLKSRLLIPIQNYLK